MNVTDDLCRLLIDAAGIIRRQSALLTLHEIETRDGALENDEADLLLRIREMVGVDDNRCICCGRIIPEGREVCPACEIRSSRCVT